MIDFLIIVILLGIAASVVFYLRREKKRGVTCAGCPYARQCAKKKNAQHTCGECSNGHARDSLS